MHPDEIRLDQSHIDNAQRILHASGIMESDHLDAGEVAHFARQLEYVKAATYDVEYTRLKTLELIPLDTSAPEGTESVTYQQWDEVGMARIVANMADDLPEVDVFSREFTSKVVSLGDAYKWTIQDVRRAMMAGSDFMLRKTRTARLAIDRRIDQIGATGATEVGTVGIVNHPNVPEVVLPNPGTFDTLTPAEVLENLNFLAQSIVTLTNDVERPNTMVLATGPYGHIASEPMLGGNGTDTILTVFLRNSPYITTVDQWTHLDGAGDSGADRILCYDKSDRVLSYNIPLLFEQLPPQPKALSFLVPCHSRVGVVEIHYPLALAYGDVVPGT